MLVSEWTLCLVLGIVGGVSSIAVNTLTCEGDVGVDHAYGDLKVLNGCKDVPTCCGACQNTTGCVGWVYEDDIRDCFLKAVMSETPCSSVKTGQPCRRELSHRTSMRTCTSNCPPPPPPTPPPPPPTPPPTTPHWLPVDELSARYRNWSYFVGGDYGGFAVPPYAGNFSGQTLVDTAVVFEKTVEDTLPGKWRMTYLFFNGTKGSNGYEVALATSDDLMNWKFNEGGESGLVFKRNPVPGTYDYGGVTFGGMLWQNNSVGSRRQLKKRGSNYYALYGCYPSRNGYEAGNGGQGMATSVDGVVWQRLSQTIPVIKGASADAPKWQNGVVYQPYLVEENGTFYDFFNARGINERNEGAEETGLYTLAENLFPGIDESTNSSHWIENPASPLLPSGPPDSFDSAMASDPKVFWDEVQNVWVMFYFGLGGGSGGHADIMIAFSNDLIRWDKDETPLYKAGGHPLGLDSQHAHKISIIFDNGVGYLYYTAVGTKGRGIALLTSKPMP
eukprot:m.91823 g.91823  ORF g.91823 m.91823 type:complete len:502 (+) comp26503_c1_seq2:82-1587(+)